MSENHGPGIGYTSQQAAEIVNDHVQEHHQSLGVTAPQQSIDVQGVPQSLEEQWNPSATTSSGAPTLIQPIISGAQGASMQLRYCFSFVTS